MKYKVTIKSKDDIGEVLLSADDVIQTDAYILIRYENIETIFPYEGLLWVRIERI